MAESIDLRDPAVFKAELEPVAETLLNRHLSIAKTWFPHELVPYSQGKDFGKGYVWDESESDMSPAVRSALYVNLLTEDNLPYYFRDIERMFGKDGAFGTWGRRWTAEEGRHSIVIRDWLTATRAIDPMSLELARMAQVSGGEVPSPDLPLTGVLYVALQELATRIAHNNTGKLIGDEAGREIMGRVAKDENLHYLFYRDLAIAAFDRDPSHTIVELEKVVRGFEMPGAGIIDFDIHAERIAKAGIYGAVHFKEQVLDAVIGPHLKVWDASNLTPEAERARTRLKGRIKALGRALLIEQATQVEAVS